MSKETFEKIEETVVETYQKIEDSVVGAYQKVEDGVVSSFTKMADKFVDKFLTREGETVEEAKQRMAAQQEKTAAENRACMDTSPDAFKNTGKHE